MGTCANAGATVMTRADLSDIYRGYIACLNQQDWPNLGKFVHEHVHYNGERIGLPGYREMLEDDFRAIPDLYFDITVADFRAAPSREPLALRLHADRRAVWPPGERQKSKVCRKCLL
jgi:predicted ester cyclase